MASDDIWKYYVFAVKALGDILSSILLPALFVLLLKYLFHFTNTVFVILLILSLVLTAVVVFRKITAYGRSFQQLGGKDELRGPRG
jgi:F0F1-type ATP synthase assembly protein I